MLLDLNPLAEGKSYLRLGAFDVSPDHRWLAWSDDTSGAESFTLRIKDLSTGEELPETIGNSSASVAWANDSETLFYVVLDSARRPCSLYRHRRGADPSTDELVYFEEDEAFYLDIQRSRSRALLLLTASSHSTAEVRFASADRPTDPFGVVVPRQNGIEYGVSHHGDRFFITTNDEASNFRLVSAPVSDPSKASWSEVLPLSSRDQGGRPPMRSGSTSWCTSERPGSARSGSSTLATGDEHLISFPEPVYSIRTHENPEFDTTVLRFTYTSMVTPSSVVEYDMAARSWTVRKQTEVLGGYDQSLYRSERLFATAPDGTRVPVSLVYRLPLERDGRRPLWLNGYGAFGISFDPGFSSNSLTLLDRGFVVAIAHVRGGEEMGRDWYEEGKLLHKQNTFGDFIAVAEHLVAEGYTSPDRLVINGGSAGGLLMGAVTNQRARPFRGRGGRGAVRGRGEHDARRVAAAHRDRVRRVGKSERPRGIRHIRAYSPYDNVGPSPTLTCS